MKILIISSARLEIEPLLIGSESVVDSDNLYFKKVGNLELYFCHGGIGIMAFTHSLTQILMKYDFAFVIHCGIAGALKSGPRIGEVVWVESDYIFDSGLQTQKGFMDLFAMKLLSKDDYPYTDGKLLNFTLNNNKTFESLPKVNAITVNSMNDNEQTTGVKSEFAQIESMEGAACHYVCAMQKVPFAHIRAISNRVGDTDKRNWNISLAVKQLNKTIQKALEEIVA